jgi:hypothetical protein
MGDELRERCVGADAALQTPPAAPELSPTVSERNAFVREVLDMYKASDEYRLLVDARDIVLEVERILETTS